jgi:Ser/Thr protein kinase RdoA (MazF antagonist)
MTNPAVQNAADWRRQRALAHLALAAFGIRDAAIRLIKYADVITLRVVSRTDGARYVLRMHPTERHPLVCLQSELWWIETLSNTNTVPVAAPYRAQDGAHIAEITHQGETRHCALFRYIPNRGRPNTLPEHMSVAHARAMGRALAHAHQIASRTTFPDWFERWEHEWVIEECADAINTHAHRLADPATRALLDTAVARIHADPNCGNWLYLKDGVVLLDFEVCAFGYFAFDVARVLVSYADIGAPPDVSAAFHDAYTAIHPAPALDSEMMLGFMLQNRIDSIGFSLGLAEFDRIPWIRKMSDGAIAKTAAILRP